MRISRSKLKLTNYALAICCMLLLTRTVYGQDSLMVMRHKYYTSYFSCSEHIPILVTYTLTKEMLDCSPELHVPRKVGHFKRDPDLEECTNLTKDYSHSGYDKGHNMSAADNGCDSEGMRECFYYSNMTPQPHSFNAGIWEKLEDEERDEALDYGAIIVSIGSIGYSGAIGPDSVVVPQYMWKVIYRPGKQTYSCYIFPDADGDDGVLMNYETTLEDLEHRTSILFTEGSPAFATQ